MIKKIFSIIFLIFLFFTANAQVNDAALWTHVTIEKKFNSFLSLELNQEFRFFENISELKTAFTEVGFQYKILRDIRVGADYRFIQRRRLDDSYSLRHQYAFILTLRKEIGNTLFIVREKFQSRYTDPGVSEDGNIPVDLLRSRLMIRYDFKKRYTPFASAEIYYQLNNPAGNEFEKLRYQLGLSYEVNKRHELSVAYLINKEINQNNPWTDYVIDIGYVFNL